MSYNHEGKTWFVVIKTAKSRFPGDHSPNITASYDDKEAWEDARQGWLDIGKKPIYEGASLNKARRLCAPSLVQRVVDAMGRINQ